MLVIEWYYLLIAQAIILILFYLNRNTSDAFELNKLFSSKIQFLVMNAGVIITCVYLNTQRQLFCIPVAWTTVMLALFCVSFLAFPFIRKSAKVFPVVVFFTGLGFFIALYIILFGRFEYFIFLGINLLFSLILLPVIRQLNRSTQHRYFNALWFYTAFVLTPYFLLYQLVLMFRSLQTRTQKTVYLSSSILVLLVGIALTLQMNTILQKTATSQNPETELRTLNKNPINNYLTELILGAHWKYHTELYPYDGWRPPFHDPVLVIANKLLFPLEHFGAGKGLPDAHDQTLYKKLYPHQATSFSCKCAAHQRWLSD